MGERCAKCGVKLTTETAEEGSTEICRPCHEALGKIKVRLALGIFVVFAGIFLYASASRYAPGALQLGPAWSEFKQKTLPVVSGLWQSGGLRSLEGVFVMLGRVAPFCSSPRCHSYSQRSVWS
jgi:hypothetical protein